MVTFGVANGLKSECQRLSVSTRELATQYLAGVIGRAVKCADFAIDPTFYLSLPTNNAIVAEAIRLIAAFAPLRILPEERLIGAATLAEAMQHTIPLTSMYSVSHTTLGFDTILHLGMRGLRQQVDVRLASKDNDAEARDLLQAMRGCLESMAVWHGRYIDELENLISMATGGELANYQELLAVCRRVPEEPPTTFHEALQALWFAFDFQRLCGNWSGIGRFDQLLSPYLDADLKSGRLTLDEARELVAHFWIKGCEWITGAECGTGDAQFYQNIVLGGIDAAGHEVTNAVTYLVLDVVEELHISDFPIAVRISERTPDKLLRRIAEVQRQGGGIVAVYNEERIINALVDFGYPLAEARNFANDGCWEIIIPGKTKFCYQPFDLLLLLQETIGLSSSASKMPIEFADFETLYQAFVQRMALRLTDLVNSGEFTAHAAPLASLLVDGCIERGRGFHSGGPRYTVLSPHAGGLPDTANSLLAIRKIVYEEKQLSLPELVVLLRDNWRGGEELCQRICARITCYGNDDAEADAMTRCIFDDFTRLVSCVPERNGILRPAGISTFGREVSDFMPMRQATASGHHKGDVLASNLSPTPGSDLAGPTAVIRSHCAMDFNKLPCGTVIDLKIVPSSVQGEMGISALVSLMRSFLTCGGLFLQIDVVDSALLRDAQDHPERYPNLSVRVSGWSARFATLAKEWQEMIITRSEQRF